MDEAPDKIWFNDAKPTEHRFVSRSSFAGGIEYTRTDTITALEAAAHARGKAEGIREAAEVCTKNAKAIRKADDYFNLRKPRGEWRAQQCDTDSAAILALLPPRRARACGDGAGGGEGADPGSGERAHQIHRVAGARS